MNEAVRLLLIGLVQIALLVGLIGTVMPIFPGLLIMWLATLGYGVAVGFSTLGTILFALITLLALLGSLADNLLMGIGAQKGGASLPTIILAISAGVIGTVIFPPLGGLIAAPLAILILEFWRLRNIRQAWRALLGMASGWGLSFVVRFAIGLVVIGFWWMWVWKG